MLQSLISHMLQNLLQVLTCYLLLNFQHAILICLKWTMDSVASTQFSIFIRKKKVIGNKIDKTPLKRELSGIENLERCKNILSSHQWNLESAIHDHLQDSEDHGERVVVPSAPPEIIDYNTHTPFVHFFRRFLFLVVTDPIADVNSFVAEFEENYGTRHPVFYIGTYSQALNDAKKDLKFMLVYLHCGDHQDTDRFCRETLSNDEVIQYLGENFVVWACSVKTPEGYRVSQALRENTYPFVAVIVLREYRMTVVGRLEGFVGPQVFITRLRAYVSDNESFLVAARADREERSFNQALRQEQDEAYQVSLQADREKEARKKREQELREQEEREKQQKLQEEEERKQALINRKLDAVNFVPEEPSPDSADCARILVRLPSGQRLERRFIRTKHTIKVHKYYILPCRSPVNFSIYTSRSKRVLFSVTLDLILTSAFNQTTEKVCNSSSKVVRSNHIDEIRSQPSHRMFGHVRQQFGASQTEQKDSQDPQDVENRYGYPDRSQAHRIRLRVTVTGPVTPRTRPAADNFDDYYLKYHERVKCGL
nr:EOG090X0B12 [Eulimnadia texana]